MSRAKARQRREKEQHWGWRNRVVSLLSCSLLQCTAIKFSSPAESNRADVYVKRRGKIEIMPVPSREPMQIGELRFQILDRQLASVTVAAEPFAVVSITGSEDSFCCIPASAHREGLLQIKFDDIRGPIDGMVPFDESHAHAILNFYRDMRAKGVRFFIVNCEMGMCRSAAVGAALAEISGGRTGWFDRRFQPNVYVRSVLLETAKSPV